MPKNKMIINNIVFIIVVSVLLAGSIASGIYLYNENQKIMEEKSAKGRELEDLQRRLELIPDLESMNEELNNEKQKLSSYIPDKEGQANFVRELEKLASSCDVQILSCQSKSDVFHHKDLPQYPVYQWELNLESNYSGLSQFLKSLSDAKRFLVVSELAVNSLFSEEDGKYLVNTRVTLDLITKQVSEKVN
ncbi:MAG TPA: type 4a pilus biogenesis protein PilO [Bacillota bacterium]|nr:type 4a pilus biogenesis protein PilO [Bacillota bacterium]